MSACFLELQESVFFSTRPEEIGGKIAFNIISAISERRRNGSRPARVFESEVIYVICIYFSARLQVSNAIFNLQTNLAIE